MTFTPKALLRALVLSLLCLQCGCVLTAGRAKGTGAIQGIPYVVHYEGEVDANTLDLLHAVSTSESLRQSPPDSILLLWHRAKEDKAAFDKVFSSRGLFAATVGITVDDTVSPVVVTFQLDPGPQFFLQTVHIALPDGQPATGDAVADAATLGLSIPSPFSAKAVVDAEKKLADYAHQHGHPFAKVAKRHVTANFATKYVTVDWTVDLGPAATFGPVRFEGLSHVKASYLTDLVPWEAGETYNADQLEQYRKKLGRLDLFTAVEVKPGTAVDGEGRVPVEVTVAERKRRTVKGGLDYKTDEGPGANLSWTHRNLFGGGEKLSLGGSVSAVERLGEVLFEKPDCITPKDLFRAKGKFADEDKKAYTGQNATAVASYRYKFTETFSVAAGLGYRDSIIKKDKTRPWENDTRYGFGFVPLEATLDTRNDLLDPQKGFLASLSFAPYWGTLDQSPNFVRPEATVATYLKLADKPGLVLAVRGSAGANLGAKAKEISPDLRFYAGGAGSIRGYSYQSVGPLLAKKPLGGGSMATFSAELRWRVTELIGIVPFVDGGSAFTETLPPYDEPILLAAGLGLRVYTPIGPVRVDVATPLARRKDIDDLVQFYCSIGQSF